MSTYDQRLRAALIEQHKRWFDYDRGALRPEVAEAIDCPVCGAKENSVAFVKDMFSFKRCGKCEMIYLNPRLSVPSTYSFYNSEWTRIYNESKFENVSAWTAFDNQINQANLGLIERHMQKPGEGSFLEIGFGSGFLLQAAQKRGYDVYGIDVDTSNWERAVPVFGGKVKNCDLAEANYPAEFFSVAYMRDVFEHVPNPKQLLQEIHRVSRPGGLVFIEIPNMDGLIYKAVGSRHTIVFGFAHLNYWTSATVTRALNDTGFEVAEIKHDSIDFTMNEVLRYYLDPAFTAVFPRNVGPVTGFVLKVLRRIVNFKWVRWADRKYTPLISNALKRGSVIRVIARKR